MKSRRIEKLSTEELVEKYLRSKFSTLIEMPERSDCNIISKDLKELDFDCMTMHKEIARRYGLDYMQVKWLDGLDVDLQMCGYDFDRLFNRVLAMLSNDSLTTKRFAKKNRHKYKCDNIIDKCVCSIDGRPCAGYHYNCDNERWRSWKYLDAVSNECRLSRTS